MLTFFSNTVTQVKPYGSFKNVLRTVACTCKAPSVKKKKKKNHMPDMWKLSMTVVCFSFFKRYRELQLVGTFNLSRH